MSEKKVVLLVSNDRNLRMLTDMRLKQHGVTTIPAAFSPPDDEKDIDIDAVMARCRQDGTKLDGVLLLNPPPAPDSQVTAACRGEMGRTDTRLKELRGPPPTLGDYGIQISVGSDNMPEAAARLDEIQTGIERDLAQYHATERGHATAYRGVIEDVLLNNPPSTKPVALIKELRKTDRKLPIMVDRAFILVGDPLLRAGATAVHTTSDSLRDPDGVDMLMTALGITPTPRPGRDSNALAGGPQSPRDRGNANSGPGPKSV